MSLISPEHSKALVWNQVDEDEGVEEGVDDYVERVDRMFAFEVAKTKEEEEGISPRLGFTVGFDALVRPSEALIIIDLALSSEAGTISREPNHGLPTSRPYFGRNAHRIHHDHVPTGENEAHAILESFPRPPVRQLFEVCFLFLVILQSNYC